MLLLEPTSMLQDMFRLGVPVIEKILRPVIVYLFLVIALRIFGKRELAQLNPFDLIVLLSLSNTVQNAIIGDDNSVLGGLIGALSLLSINYLVVRYLFRHRRLDQILEGTPTTLVREGKVQRVALAKELLSESELRTVAHRQGFKLHEIEKCVLEPGGVVSIEGKKPSQDERFHKELLDQMSDLRVEIQALQKRLGG
jgi:uncharacterized membrane protein YcaP (DUF421 family)